MHPGVWVFLFITTVCLRATAQDGPIEPDRPDQSESAALVPPRHVQVETGFSFEKGKDFKLITHPALLLRYGASRYFELRLALEAQSLYATGSHASWLSGFVPLEIGVKINLATGQKAKPSASLISHLIIPQAASEGFHSPYVGCILRLAMQHACTEWFTLSYNVGAAWEGESAEPIFLYTLTAGFALTESFGAFAETYGFFPQKASASHLLDGGFTFQLKPFLMLDISGGWNITNRSYYAGTGFSIRLPN
ncbi:MAG: hypothetical protein KatS3mg031_1860 [Chitinophagales bacterium]|nr:MAG: hypothetical protein KatS3mg031_1860 [Chitinophagales bacterium]